MSVFLNPFGVIFILIFAVFEVHAASETSVYRRCYFQITGRPLPLQSPTLTQVKNGTMTAVQACLSHLEQATLQTNGLPANQGSVSSGILEKFETFHRTWFSASTIEDIQGYSDEIAPFTRHIFDGTEPSLSLTYALLRQDFLFSNILRQDLGLRAIRQDDPIVRARIGWTVSYAGRGRHGNSVNFDNTNLTFAVNGAVAPGIGTGTTIIPNAPKIQVGELMGIQSVRQSLTAPNVHLHPLGPPGYGHTIPGLKFSFDIFGTYGGGIIGTPIYLMMNFGHTYGTIMNGTTKIPRRWAENTLKSFMCLSFPNLRDEDTVRFVRMDSVTPFRKATSCVGCHATLDRMANVARNKLMVNSDYGGIADNNPTQASPTILMTEFNATVPASSGWPSEPTDPGLQNFHLQTPTGFLYFRGFDGRLVEIPVSGINQMALAISQQPEFYQCAVKRYVSLFTGYDVHLYDRSDRRNEQLNRTLTNRDRELRNWIEQMATNLQSHQSLKRLIQEILSSNFYRETVGGIR